MLDSSDCIRTAVYKCTELWDDVYHTVCAIVKDLRNSKDNWIDYMKHRDLLLMKISDLSLNYKKRPMSQKEVSDKYSGLQNEVGIKILIILLSLYSF